MSTKGASVYLSAQELDALHTANDHLMGLLDSASDEAAIADLIGAKTGLHRIIEKARKSRRAAKSRTTLKAALQSAENT